MPDRKYWDIADWREQGFLQEANRLFFHPHGQALAVKRATDEGERVWLGLGGSEALLDILDAAVEAKITTEDAVEGLRDSLHKAQPIHKNQCVLAAIWDESDDPEGIVFGEDPDDKREKAERVLAERSRRALARYRLFHGDHGDGDGASLVQLQADVEPVDWVMPSRQVSD